MDGDMLDSLTDEILEKELGMKLYAHRTKFLKILERLKSKTNSPISQSTHYINFLVSKKESFIIFDYGYYIMK
jgi:hypothetical protein